MAGRNLYAEQQEQAEKKGSASVGRNLYAASQGPVISSTDAVNEVARNLDSSPNIATQGALGLLPFVLGNEARQVGAGAATQNVIENLMRAGQWAGESVGILDPGTKARLEQSLSYDDQGAEALFREQPVEANIGRAGAEAGMFFAVPGGREGGLLTRAVTGGLAGAGTAAITTGEGEGVWDRAAIGGIFGAGMPILIAGVKYPVEKYGPALARATSRVLGKYSPARAGREAPQMIADGQFTDDALRILRQNNLDPSQLDDQVARQLQRDGLLTAEQAENFNYFKQFDPDYRPTLAEVTQAGDDFMRQQELAKGTNAVSRLISDNEEVIERNVRRQVETVIGAQISDPVTAGMAVREVAENRINAADDAVNAAYRAVRESLSDGKVIQPTKLVAALDRYKGRNTVSGGYVEAVLDELRQRGIVSQGPNGIRIARVDADTAEQVRIVINDLYRGDKAARSELRGIFTNALDGDVETAAGQDFFKAARAAKASLERSLERARRTYRAAGRDTVLTKLVEDRIPDRNLAAAVMQADAVEIKQLFAFLESGTPEQVAAGKAAIDQLRGAMVWDMYSKALVGKAEGGAQMLSGFKLRQQLNRYGRIIPEIFTPEQQSWLAALGRVGELRIPKTGTQQGLGPSAPGMRVAAEQLIDFGDETASRHFGLLKRILTIGSDTRDIVRATNPAGVTARTLESAQRGPNMRPFSGSVGAVTADRLPAETER
jgi:hypothetical protein